MKDNSIHIAIAEDHTAVREATIDKLTNQYNVIVDIEVGDGKELLAQLSKAKRLPDVCLLDISMPKMKGFEAQVEMMKRWPKIKTLVFTTYDAEALTLHMMAAGAKGYLQKTCSFAELARAISAIHKDGIYHSEITNTHIISAFQRGEVSYPVLEEQELAVLEQICSGLTQEQITVKLGLTPSAVQWSVKKLFENLHVHNKKMVSLSLYAIQLGLVDPNVALANIMKH